MDSVQLLKSLFVSNGALGGRVCLLYLTKNIQCIYVDRYIYITLYELFINNIVYLLVWV